MASITKSIPAADKVYCSDAFLSLIEVHRRLIIGLSTTKKIFFDPERTTKFRYNPQAMFAELKIDYRWRSAILRLNNLRNNVDFDETVTYFYVPDNAQLERLLTAHLAMQGRI